MTESKVEYHIHDHEDILGRPNFRHDHDSSKYPDGKHRHLSRNSKMLLPPKVEGCLQEIVQDEKDCYILAAEGELTFSERCGPCRDAWKV